MVVQVLILKNVARRLGIELPVKRKINPKETFNRKYKYCFKLWCRTY